MKLTFKKLSGKYVGGWFDQKATIVKGPNKFGWLYQVNINGRFMGGGNQPTLREAKMCAEEIFFGGAK